MRFGELIEGRLVRRYKRFLADVELGDGRLLRQAVAAGVEVLAYAAEITKTGIRLVEPLPVAL